MATETSELSGIIISLAPRAERYTRWEVFSRAEGFVGVTVPAKLALPFGLFDAIELVGTVKGKGLFAKEIRLMCRPDGLGKNLNALHEASRLANLMHSAFRQMPDYEPIFDLFEKALTYYSTTSADPALITFKAFYKMLSAEGFPVKEDWLESLPTEESKKAQLLLNAPMEGAASENSTSALESLIQWANKELGMSQKATR